MQDAQAAFIIRAASSSSPLVGETGHDWYGWEMQLTLTSSMESPVSMEFLLPSMEAASLLQFWQEAT